MGQFTNSWRLRVRRLEYLIERALRAGQAVANAWLQGGNAFGATGVFGTLDNNPVNVITNSVTRFAFDTSGNIVPAVDNSGSVGTSARRWGSFIGVSVTAGGGASIITVNPAAGLVVRWGATQAALAAGDIGMDLATGRGTLFVGGVSQEMAVLGDLPGGGAATFPATITSASPQYTAIGTDRLIEVDVSGGQPSGGLPIKFDAAATTGTQHTVKVVAGDAAVNTVGVSGNGQNIEDPNNLGTFTASTVFIKSPGGAVTWMFDANNRWAVIASA
jgi:hypothetical protein